MFCLEDAKKWSECEISKFEVEDLLLLQLLHVTHRRFTARAYQCPGHRPCWGCGTDFILTRLESSLTTVAIIRPRIALVDLVLYTEVVIRSDLVLQSRQCLQPMGRDREQPE